MSTFRYYAEIDMDAFEHNIREIRRKIGEDTMLCAVVKANGYGHGAVALAKAMEAMGVDWLAVSCADEGIELRHSGITLPILVLGASADSQFEDMIRENITPTIFTLKAARALDRAADAFPEKKPVNIHIKLDTGMGRIGFSDDEKSIQTILEIGRLPNLRIEGLFTHFACADMYGTERTNRQLERYEAMAERLKNEGLDIPVKHCANSAGIMAYEGAYMNMVRAGIIIYGLYPSDEVDKSLIDLYPVMSLRSHITFIKEVPEGTEISYGATFVTSRPSKIATVPVGYADGYFRQLSGKGRVLIKGQYAPIVGRVCMDQMMVDITDLSDIDEGDVVTLVGKDGIREIPVEEPAALAGSFNYEFVCNVSRRVPRVYMKNGQKVGEVSYLL